MNRFSNMINYSSAVLLIAAFSLLISTGCGPGHVPGSEVRVAKVDTEYVYEANITEHVENYRESRRTRISNFVGFTPDEILAAREHAIDNEIRKEIKRLPGVDISSQEVRELADGLMEELAWDIHEMLIQDGAEFADLAREESYGVNARSGGKLKAFSVVDNPESYQKMAYTMEIGDISEPFSAWDGWRIIKLDDITEDAYIGTQYHISMILLKPDLQHAEGTIIDGIAEEHTIEILDPKYNARRAYIDGNYDEVIARSDEVIGRNADDDLAHYLRACALWRLDRTDEAFAEIDKAAESGKVSAALVPYYFYYKGQWLEELDRIDDALEAYRQSFDNWRQDIYLAYDLRDVYERLDDNESLELIAEEIDDIARQDALIGRRPVAAGVIVTGGGRVESNSAQYEPGYRGN